jgi:hypothetical protein
MQGFPPEIGGILLAGNIGRILHITLPNTTEKQIGDCGRATKLGA